MRIIDNRLISDDHQRTLQNIFGITFSTSVLMYIIIHQLVLISTLNLYFTKYNKPIDDHLKSTRLQKSNGYNLGTNLHSHYLFTFTSIIEHITNGMLQQQQIDPYLFL